MELQKYVRFRIASSTCSSYPLDYRTSHCCCPSCRVTNKHCHLSNGLLFFSGYAHTPSSSLVISSLFQLLYACVQRTQYRLSQRKPSSVEGSLRFLYLCCSHGGQGSSYFAHLVPRNRYRTFEVQAFSYCFCYHVLHGKVSTAWFCSCAGCCGGFSFPHH